MKERYEIIKSVYPNYLILFKSKGDIKYYGKDKEMVDLFGKEKLKNVNKIILNNLEIEETYECEDNLYEIYYEKYMLIKSVKGL